MERRHVNATLIGAFLLLAVLPTAASENQFLMTGAGPSWFSIHFHLPAGIMVFSNLTSEVNPDGGQMLLILDSSKNLASGGPNAAHPSVPSIVEANATISGNSVARRIGSSATQDISTTSGFIGSAGDYFVVGYVWGAVGPTHFEFAADPSVAILSMNEGATVFALRPDDPVGVAGAGARLGSVGAAFGTGQVSFHVTGDLFGNFGSYNHGPPAEISEGMTTLAGPTSTTSCPCGFGVSRHPSLGQSGDYAFSWTGFGNGPVDNNDIAYWADIQLD